MDVSLLIKDLSAAGVESFEGYGVKVTFHRKDHKIDHKDEPIITRLAALMPKLDSDKEKINPQSPQTSPQFDPGLAQVMEAEMDPDKLLHWSSSQDPKELQVETPLTGDAPLTEG